MDARSECLVEVLEEAHTTTNPKEGCDMTPTATEIGLSGWVGGRLLTILVDCGSTHDFIQDMVVKKLGITMEPLPAFRVFIASGEFLVCKEVCRQVTLTLQNVVLTEDLFILNLGGSNVMLGIQWFEKLGW